ncbi:hypothetical protein [Hyphomicrobium sp.]|uniref:hypothetical protein n=1 Tax=Hyphomicrobium sp. TaxID=82 RepID=UPI001DB26FE7|nr:hypothetical protein [Hyphomicrobium sp.]MBY0560032.1 hypothetical protein [Hyphomicrobium sp.]
MALSFVQKKSAPAQYNVVTKPAESPKKTGTVLSFLKTGQSAREALTQEEAKAELAKQEQGKLWRFWMPDGEDRRVTFLDGEMSDDGLLDVPMFYQHTIRINGNWESFVCTADADTSQPCPLCESGDKPSLVGVMTVIDHSEHKVKNGPNAGAIIKNTRKLFLAKRNTIKQLTKLAAKRDGLAGCTFDVSRTDDKQPSVGNQFDFVEKFESYDDIADKYGLKIEDAQPADYTQEIRYRKPEELIELGVGKAVKSALGTKKVSSAAISDEL